MNACCFSGEYEYTIDAKRRLAIPAEVRDVFNPQDHGNAFVAAPGANGSLWLWPERTFEEQARDLERSLLGDDDLDDFERLLFSPVGTYSLGFGWSGGVCQNGYSPQYGLSGLVMVLGVRDHLELMTPEAWREEQAQMGPARDEIWRRARQAMAARRAGQDQ